MELLISSTPPDSGPSKVGDWTALWGGMGPLKKEVL